MYHAYYKEVPAYDSSWVVPSHDVLKDTVQKIADSL